MLYQNIGALIIEGYNSAPHSRVIFFTPGNDYAVIKARYGGTWLPEYEETIQLPYAYSGDSILKIWLVSDIHVEYKEEANTNFTNAIQDIDDNVGVDYVLAIGDLAHYETYLSDYVTIRNTSDVPASNWIEVAGNHDVTSGGSGFLSTLGYSDFLNIVNINNITIVVMGHDVSELNANLSTEELTFLENALNTYKNTNIFIACHFPVKDTTYGSNLISIVEEDSNAIKTLLSTYRAEAWFHGHLHYDLSDGDLSILSPRCLYLYDEIPIDYDISIKDEYLEDSLEIEENVKLSPCIENTVRQSKYGEFVYAQDKYGMNVRICEEHCSIEEDFLTKVNGEIWKTLDDSLDISEDISLEVDFSLSLDDSISISEDILTEQGFYLSLDDSVPISESVGNGITLNLSDSLSIDDTGIYIERLTSTIPKTNWKFYIRDSAGNYVASLVNARGRWFKEGLNQGGSAGFILDTDDENCTEDILKINQNELIIIYKGFEMFGGQISTIVKKAEGNVKYWEVTCKQFFNLLEQRFCGYNKSTGLSEPREFTTTDAGTIAWTLIDESQSETNGDLGITQGTIQTSLNRTKTYERKNVAEAIKELADNDYGFDFEITPDKVFNVYYPLKGSLLYDVVFRYPGNCLSMECTLNGWEVVNHELGLGRHWGGQEIYYVVDDVSSQVDYGRREKIASYKDVEIQAFLNDMVEEDIAWNKDINKVVKFSAFIDTKSDLYMYELGDAVRVVADDFDINEMLFVYERQVNIDDNELVSVNLTLGD